MPFFMHPLPLVSFIGVLCAIVIDAVLVEIVNISRVSARYKMFELEHSLGGGAPALSDLEETSDLA